MNGKLDFNDVAVSVGISTLAALVISRGANNRQIVQTPGIIGAATPADVALAKQQAIAAASIQSSLDSSAANLAAVATSKVNATEVAGRNGAGAVAFAGAKVGDRVLSVIGIVTATGVGIPGSSANFETTISIVNQIQQTSAANLTGNTYVFTSQT